jgi:hypothetical protein
MFRTHVAIPSERRVFDTIVYKESLWLVSEWTSTDPLTRRPALLIGGSGLTFEAWPGMGLLGRLNSKSPTMLLSGRIPEGEEALFTIERNPLLDVPMAAE